MKIRIFLASAAMLCSAVMLSHIHAAAENIRRTPVFSGIEQFELPMGTPESWENPEEGETDRSAGCSSVLLLFLAPNGG